ncbi:nitrilase-related carbon-nitrogen hydrolase [Candidatus Aquiluna sp. UB-MaderosW2red]|uniref:nitrilase-related carbon-nitrogen hydrolase n=1 Tax=Candidatus Aquiluna sp. UB-MaderosW2red TaxID=1855377 RepID=UPI000875BD2A|nr:nitrilase-related carbon-nitrogen hydrolase [Candidatus Aquiluna sp. UB-MaderosW2red]SCX10107.1 N-carbamoylputrescine amidase [Candidatus Aquiluna sp. UB-MaderosW2red]
MKVTIAKPQPLLSRTKEPERAELRVAALQVSWRPDPQEHRANLELGIRRAKEAGAQVVFLPELTLSRYPADMKPAGNPSETAEPLLGGETYQFISKLAAELSIFIHASLFEDTGFEDGRGLNIAIVVGPGGHLAGKTPKLHIPVTAGYFENKYFQEGPNLNPYPVYQLGLEGNPRLGLPTCWDEWFPEVARAYGLAGADVLCYPTAIGSEPNHPEFDTEPLWRATIVGHAVANGLFMVVPNRWGNEGLINFYGSSFICDPYGRILAQAGREGDELLVANLDLDLRRDWLELFPFFGTRRPETYSSLTSEIQNPRADGGSGVNGGIAGLSK